MRSCHRHHTSAGQGGILHNFICVEWLAPNALCSRVCPRQTVLTVRCCAIAQCIRSRPCDRNRNMHVATTLISTCMCYKLSYVINLQYYACTVLVAIICFLLEKTIRHIRKVKKKGTTCGARRHRRPTGIMCIYDCGSFHRLRLSTRPYACCCLIALATAATLAHPHLFRQPDG